MMMERVTSGMGFSSVNNVSKLTKWSKLRYRKMKESSWFGWCAGHRLIFEEKTREVVGLKLGLRLSESELPSHTETLQLNRNSFKSSLASLSLVQVSSLGSSLGSLSPLTLFSRKVQFLSLPFKNSRNRSSSKEHTKYH